jgi:hypothetical protein
MRSKSSRHLTTQQEEDNVKKLPIYAMAGVATGLVAAALVLTLASSNFQPGPSTVTAAGAGSVASAAEAGVGGKAAGAPVGGPSEGIRVHGDWTIEIRQPDGSLVSRSQFQNALTSMGRYRLSTFLSRANTPGAWAVTLDGTTSSTTPCRLVDGTTPTSCNVVESISGLPTSGYVSKNLTVSVPTSGPNASKLVLSGSMTAGYDGDVKTVGTYNWVCSSATAPDSCTGTTGPYSITVTSLGTAIPVSAGQQILVTVVISFS